MIILQTKVENLSPGKTGGLFLIDKEGLIRHYVINDLQAVVSPYGRCLTALRRIWRGLPGKLVQRKRRHSSMKNAKEI